MIPKKREGGRQSELRGAPKLERKKEKPGYLESYRGLGQES